MLGVYVHFPWCRHHCPYCDFNVVRARGSGPPHAEYRDAVLAELEVRAPDYAGRPPVVSVYFGGGTPALWAPSCVGAVLEGVAARLGLAPGAEVTIEANPDDVTAPGMRALRAAGVNRLSLGTQSFDDAVLERLGRLNRAADNLRALDAVRSAGFDNLSLDLIQAVAGQSPEAALADAEAVAALAPAHVSTYQLTIAPQTPFGARAARGEVLVAPEDDQAAIYEGTRAVLAEAGILPYEISNAARPGLEAVHNSLYWTGDEYLALGAGAHGFRRLPAGEGERWENERHAGRYMAAALAGRPAERRERLDEPTLREERVLTGLRLDAGFVPDAPTRAAYGPAADRLVRSGLLEDDGRTWRATPRGRLLLDHLLARLTADPTR